MRGVRALSFIELKLFAREPVTVVFTLALPPLVLYVMAEVFGNDPSPGFYHGAGPLNYYVPAYIGIVIASLGLIGLPVHLAAYREKGVLRRFQAARVSTPALLVAQLFVAVVGVLAGAVVLVTLARLSYHVAWPANWPGVLFAVALGTVEFTAIGFLLGVALPTARAAQGIGVLLWFLMFMVSGGGPPPEVLGGALGAVGAATPLKHLIIALQDPWLGHGVNWTETLVVTAILLAAAGLAVPALRRRG